MVAFFVLSVTEKIHINSVTLILDVVRYGGKYNV